MEGFLRKDLLPKLIRLTKEAEVRIYVYEYGSEDWYSEPKPMIYPEATETPDFMFVPSNHNFIQLTTEKVVSWAYELVLDRWDDICCNDSLSEEAKQKKGEEDDDWYETELRKVPKEMLDTNFTTQFSLAALHPCLMHMIDDTTRESIICNAVFVYVLRVPMEIADLDSLVLGALEK